MVHIEVVRSCNSTLVKKQPLVAVFVGGTAGIGESSVRALAATHSVQGKGLRLYIVGRNADAAEKIISDCVRICPVGQFRFVPAEDLALLKDVDRVCAEIVRAEENENKYGETARLDILVMSQGYISFEPRRETKEGLDTLLSLRYYSRMRFIINLLPLLLASPLPAHVVSVFAAGREGKFYPEDLSLRDPEHYGVFINISHVAYMTTFFVETLATRHPGQLSLVHVYPGLVMTNEFQTGRFPLWFKMMWRWLVAPIVWPFSVPLRECGERILFLATPRFPAWQTTEVGIIAQEDDSASVEGNVAIAIGSDGNYGSGAYAVNWNGETIPTEKAYKRFREDGLAERVWDHTMKAFEDIEAGNVFTG
ncbi:hypothetical protein V1517DRAFT_170511 [Lipomyces orientalis]|uniref:Uncharacterized protein n=1 Tax=Lipomyces orientalis TaxID=1233043 RepID=A0ACC3TK76_9ASCO